jgi:hypothetical protein
MFGVSRGTTHARRRCVCPRLHFSSLFRSTHAYAASIEFTVTNGITGRQATAGPGATGDPQRREPAFARPASARELSDIRCAPLETRIETRAGRARSQGSGRRIGLARREPGPKEECRSRRTDQRCSRARTGDRSGSGARYSTHRRHPEDGALLHCFVGHREGTGGGARREESCALD